MSSKIQKLVRQSCFETNSSSAHSISIGLDKDFILDTIFPNEKGVVHIKLQQFGWDWFKTNDPETKAAYCYQAWQNNFSMQQLLIDIIMEQTCAKEVIFYEEEKSYIDHQSFENLDKEGVKNFIFNKNSWLFGGNDNENPEPGFYDVPVFRNSNNKITVDKPMKKYALVFPNLSNCSRRIVFSRKPNVKEVADALSWAFAWRKGYLACYNNRDGCFVEDEHYEDRNRMENVFDYETLNCFNEKAQIGKVSFVEHKTKKRLTFNFNVKKFRK